MSEGHNETPKNTNKRSRHCNNSPPSPESCKTVQKHPKTMTDYEKLKDLIEAKASETNALLQSTIQEELGKLQTGLQQSLDEVTSEVTLIQTTLKQYENQSRKKNLIIHGIPETAMEKWSDVDDKIKDLGTKMGIIIDYDHAYRLGRKGKAKRPIMLKLLRTKDKFMILGAGSKLKGLDIYINEDQSPEERKQNTILLKKRKELKAGYPDAKISIKSGKLYYNDSIRSVTYTVDEHGNIQEKPTKGSGSFPMDTR